MIRLFGHSYVVDASPKLLSHVKAANGDDVTTYNSLFEDFTPLDGHKFNTVIATHILEHVDNPVRVLKKHVNGWLRVDLY